MKLMKNYNNQPFFRQRLENYLVDKYFEFPRLLLRTDYLRYQHVLRSIETDNSAYPDLNGPITPEVIHVICVNKPKKQKKSSRMDYLIFNEYFIVFDEGN